ncbi:MAG: BA14K family protein [Shinella sp.]|nr:BA14K family protein [Shinella sp.]
MSALFALTPVVPAQAMPMPVAKAHPAETVKSPVQTVQEVRPWLRDNGRRWRGDRDWRRGRGDWRGGRDWRGRRDWSGSRRYWRGRDYGWRRGYYRGYRGYPYYRSGYRYRDGYWFPLAAFGAGALLGGAIAADRGPVYRAGGSHAQWCYNRYRSYRAYDNTFQPYNGPRRQCISPYR